MKIPFSDKITEPARQTATIAFIALAISTIALLIAVKANGKAK